MQLLALAFFFIDFHMTVNISGKAHCRESMQVPVKAVSSVKGLSLLKDVCCIRAFMFSFFLFYLFFPHFNIWSCSTARFVSCHFIFLAFTYGDGLLEECV